MPGSPSMEGLHRWKVEGGEGMTLKLQAYQKYGIKTDELVEEFEFCCWDDLHEWLKNFHELHKCPKCKKLVEVKEAKE